MASCDIPSNIDCNEENVKTNGIVICRFKFAQI